MGIFKNEVGRPSNRIKRIRRGIYALLTMTVLTVFGLSFYFILRISNKADILSSIELSKLSGSANSVNAVSIGSSKIYITYIDNLKGNKAFKNYNINVNEKFVYTGSDSIYYKLSLYKNRSLVEEGVCRAVAQDSIASISFQLADDGLNVVTEMFKDSECSKRVLRYKTKTYYIGEEKSSEIKSSEPTMSVPKFNTKWKVGENSGLFNVVTENPVGQQIRMVSSNPEIMQVVEEQGKFMLVAKAKGTVTITTSSSLGLETKNVYVVEESTKITVNKTSENIDVGDVSKLVVLVSPSNQTLSIKENNDSVLNVKKIDNNTWEVIGNKAGTSELSVMASDGTEEKIKYTVKNKNILSATNYNGVLTLGKDETLNLQVSPSNTTISVNSSNEKILAIEKKSDTLFKLLPKNVGEASITIKASNGITKTYKYNIIEDKKNELTMTKYSDELYIGKTYGKFQVNSNVSVSSVTVKSSNPDILQVMKYGDNSLSKNSWGLKAKSVGTVTITAEASNGSKLSYKYMVVEEPKIEVSNIVSKLKEGTTTDNLKVSVTPSTDSIKLASSNQSVLQVIDNKNNTFALKALKIGSSILSIESSSGIKQSYLITVEQTPKLVVSAIPSTIYIGQSEQKITVNVTPSTDTVTIKSSNDNLKVVTYNSNSFGITGVKAGTSKLTVSSSSGTKQDFNINIKAQSKVELPLLNSAMYVGDQTNKFSLKVEPNSDTVTLTSGNPNIIEVIRYSENSYSLKAKKAGTAVLKVESKSGASNNYTFTVKEKSSISFVGIASTLETGKTYTIKMNVTPQSDKVNLASSNSNVLTVNSCQSGSCIIAAKKAGTVTLTASTSSGAKVSHKVSVVNAKMTTNISDIPTNMVFGEFEILTVDSLSSVTVVSSNPNIIGVKAIVPNKSWSLDPCGIGTAKITITSNGNTVNKTINVVAPQGKEMISTTLKNNATLSAGSETSKFKVNYYPNYAYVRVESNDPKGLQIMKYGDNTLSKNSWSLKALKAGTYRVTIKTSKNQSFTNIIDKVIYTINVKEAEKKLLINGLSDVINLKYATGWPSLAVTVIPTNASVTLTSSDPNKVAVKKVENKNAFQILAIDDNGTVNLTLKSSNGLSKVYKVNLSGNAYPTVESLVGASSSNYKTTALKDGSTLLYSKSCSTQTINNFINMVNKLPSYAKKSAQRVYLIDYTTWAKKGWTGVAGWTCPGYKPYIYVPCGNNYTYSGVSSNYGIYHEFGHAIDARYNAVTLSGDISNQQKYVYLKNSAQKYTGCNSSKGKCSILRGYAYSNVSEFFAESYMMTVRTQVGYSQKDSISNSWGPTNTVSFSPYGTIDAEIKKTIKEVEKVIK